MTLEATPRTPAFGNGRFVRNLFEHCRAARLAAPGRRGSSSEELRLLTEDDVMEQPEDDQEPLGGDPDGPSETVPAGSEQDLPTDRPTDEEQR